MEKKSTKATTKEKNIIENHKTKKSIILGIIVLLIVMFILLGLTYAYYRTNIIGNSETSISATSKKLEVKYIDGEASISATESVRPGFTATKEFSIENTGTEKAYFSIILDNVVNEYNKASSTRGEYYDWSYSLEEVSKTKTTSPIKTGNITFDSTQIMIGSVGLDAKATKNYKLTITYEESDEDQSADMGSIFSLRVNISDEIEEKITWDNAKKGTLLYALKTNQPTGTEETVPGREASTANEARIVKTEDDYGTSYIYRGSVKNNYVTYSNMCWRVVRIDGNSNIKLILADESSPCSGDNSTYSTSNTTSAFITNDNGKIIREYYLGDIVEDPYGMNPPIIPWTDTSADFPFEKSKIPVALETWAQKVHLNTAKLAEIEWCNDTAITSLTDYRNQGGPLAKFTGPYTRQGNPSLKCDTKGVEGTTGTDAAAIKYVNVLGILSADELRYAGMTGTANENVYLYSNAINNYWTISPSDVGEEYDANATRIFIVSSEGKLSNSLSIMVSHAIRPSIVLKNDTLLSTTTTSTQNGTQSNPYVIN